VQELIPKSRLRPSAFPLSSVAIVNGHKPWGTIVDRSPRSASSATRRVVKALGCLDLTG
jgi:hypothetical protein